MKLAEVIIQLSLSLSPLSRACTRSTTSFRPRHSFPWHLCKFCHVHDTSCSSWVLIHDVVLTLPYYESKSAAISAVQHLLNMRAEQMHNSFSGFWRILNELLMDNSTHAWLGSLYSWIKRKAYSLVHNGWSSLEKSDSYGCACATCRSVYAGSCYSDSPSGRGCQWMQAGVMEPAVSLMGWLHRLWSLCAFLTLTFCLTCHDISVAALLSAWLIISQ